MSKVEKLDGATRERGKEDVLLGLMARPAASKPKGGSLIQEMGACDPPSTPDISEGVDTGKNSDPMHHGSNPFTDSHFACSNPVRRCTCYCSASHRPSG